MTDDQIADAKAKQKAIMDDIEAVVALARAADPEDDRVFMPIGEAIGDINRKVNEILGLDINDLL